MKMIATPVKEFAIEKNLPVFQPEKVKKNVDKNQKDYLLREQQKVIREELGEDDIVSEADEYLEKCEALKASKEVKDKIKKEIKRYKKMPPVAAESTMTKNYIETMLEMPWNKVSRDSKSLEKAMEILDKALVKWQENSN